jgi:uncharacterized protein YkwD
MTMSSIPASPLSLPFTGALTLVLAATLAACGGGSDATDTANEAPATVASSTSAEALGETAPVFVASAEADTTAPNEQAQAVVAGSVCALANFQAEMMQRINAYRARGASCGSYGSFGPTTALAWNDLLQSAATRHSKDMAGKNFFSHTGSDGSSAGTRITQAGYAWSTWGENIAAGYGTVQAVVDGWMASPGHCANLMKPAFRHVGVACVNNSTSTYKKYWTLDLAAPR